MSRYLTSSKVALLALIALYTDAVVPSTATVPILSFTISYLLPVTDNLPRLQSTLPSQGVKPAIEDFQKATIKHSSGIPGRTIWDLLLQKVWKIDSFDALQVFFEALSSILQRTSEEQQEEAANRAVRDANRILLSRISPLGSFVRRAQLEFTRLPLHDGIALWKSFVAYRQPTLSHWRKRNQSAGNTSFDSNLCDGDLSWEDPLINVVYKEIRNNSQCKLSTSSEDVEKLLDYQIDHMQSE